MARSRIECKNDTAVDSMNFGHILSSSCHPWTLVAALKGLETLEDYGVILIPEGLIECSTWSCSMYETCNTMPVTMRQSLCNYIHHWEPTDQNGIGLERQESLSASREQLMQYMAERIVEHKVAWLAER